MALATKIAQNTIVQLVGKVISTALGLISLALMTRYLGQAGFGEYTAIINFLSFFAVIADLGLTLVTVQMISVPGVDEKKILNNLFGLRLLSIVLFISLAPLAAFFLPYSATVKAGILIAAASFLFPALSQVLIGLFQKRLRMDKAVIAENISRVVLLVGIYLSVHYNYGLNGILWASVISAAVNFLIGYLLALPFIGLRPSFDKQIWSETIKKSWPLAITIVLNLLYLKTDTLILSLVKSSSEVGLYGAAYRIIDVLSTLPFMFAGIILPLLTAYWFEQKKELFKSTLQKSFDLMAIISLPIISGALILSKPIVVLVAGADFAASGLILKILIFAILAIFLGCMFAHAVVAIDQQKKMIKYYLFVSISSVILYLILIPKFSYLGAATATVYSEVAIALFSAYLVWQQTKFIPNSKIIIKSIIAASLMGLFLYTIPNHYLYNWLWLIVSITLSSILYFAILYLLKGITKNDLQILLNKK